MKSAVSPRKPVWMSPDAYEHPIRRRLRLLSTSVAWLVILLLAVLTLLYPSHVGALLMRVLNGPRP